MWYTYFTILTTGAVSYTHLLSTTHLQMILYFMCDIGFSQEMIATLYRTAHSRGKTSPKYMEAIGLT